MRSALSLEVLRCRLHCACGGRAARLEGLRSVLSFSFQRCHFHCDCNWSTTIFDLIELCTFISFLPLLLAVWSWRARDRILFELAPRIHLISAMGAPQPQCKRQRHKRTERAEPNQVEYGRALSAITMQVVTQESWTPNESARPNQLKCARAPTATTA